MSNKTKTETTTQEQKNKLDPRMDALLYGGNGTQGLTQRATDLANQPAINSRMREGMDTQYNYLKSPLYQAIFNQMLGSGQNLMGRGVAGNPFTQSGAGLRQGGGGGSPMQGFAAPQGGMGYQQNYTPSPPQQAAPQQIAPQPLAPQDQTQSQAPQLTPEMLAYFQRMYQTNTNSA
jgi:hypothetical protein